MRVYDHVCDLTQVNVGGIHSHNRHMHQISLNLKKCMWVKYTQCLPSPPNNPIRSDVATLFFFIPYA